MQNEYLMRVYGVVEFKVRADSIEDAMAQCDLNAGTVLNGVIVEIDDVIEAEEV